MITVNLQNSKISVEQPVSIYDLIKQHTTNYKTFVAANINGAIVDLSTMVTNDCDINLVANDSTKGLEIIRHSCAHLLAQALIKLYPDTKIYVGPVTEYGFFYDVSTEHRITEDDIPLINKTMHALAKQNLIVKRNVLAKDAAIDLFAKKGQDLKLPLINKIEDSEVTTYSQGDFIDLCKGPHVPSTGYLKAFKVTKVSGAYLEGDAKNQMLQRVYGLAFASKEALEAHEHMLLEAKKRDHRVLGKVMDLFHFQKEAPGMCFWHHKGNTIYDIIKAYIQAKLEKRDYQTIKTPLVVDKSLWEKSGHWDKFKSEMYVIEDKNQVFAIKPMNCPCHVQVYNNGIKSYKDLPLRLSEFGSCHRNEYTGALHGLMRLKNFTIDDAHIFCTEDQIQSEVGNFIDLVYEVYKDFGFDKVELKLATRPIERVGSDEIWDKAENGLITALQSRNLAYTISEGEGAFYGPKIEFSLQDKLGRLWQCGTVQIDFSMPERLEAMYVDEQNVKQTTVMIHRAIIGSFERFIGILLEHYAGILPLWLSPVQIVVMNIADDTAEYATEIVNFLRDKQIRAELDLRNEKIGYKIRGHTLAKVSLLAIVGRKEKETQTISLRSVSGENLGEFSKSSIIEYMNKKIMAKN